MMLRSLDMPRHRTKGWNADRPSPITYDSLKPGLFREKLKSIPTTAPEISPAGIK
jgi:hypothetical protein